jgi:predicted nuclease of predicted toxin-antitoxin system
MRRKLDENLPASVANVFVDSGHDVDTVLEEGLGGAPDARVMEKCSSEERVLFTLDSDFGDIRALFDRHP